MCVYTWYDIDFFKKRLKMAIWVAGGTVVVTDY